MAERKATNKYYPPDWDPSKGSVNKLKKSHPLRDRARKIGEGIIIVRFEMPFNIWCLKCDNHIGMGVRYNAEKSRVGSYYSSPIYKFRMKCHLCDNHFEIQSDPSKFDYIILNGARKQVRTSNETYDADQIVIDTEETKRKLTDAMFRLEKKIEDKFKAEATIPEIHELKKWRSQWEDSFSANQLVRSQFRQRRKKLELSKKNDKALLQKASLRISLVKSNPLDLETAKKMLEECKRERMKSLEARKKQEILNSKDVSTKVKVETVPHKVGSGSKDQQRNKQWSASMIKSDPGVGSLRRPKV